MTAIFSIFEIILLCLGGTLFIYRPGLIFSEALSSGIVLALITLSCIFQTAFLLSKPNLAFFLEGFTIIICFLILKKRGKYLNFFYQRFKDFCRQNKLICILLSIAWLYLGLQAILLPPANWDSMTYNLARVLLFQQEKSLYLSNITTFRQAVFPVGADILHHIFLRFYTDYGIGIFSFLAYISVGFATYALSQRYTSSQISLMATLVIMSLPEFVYQATSTKNDIITAAAATFCFLTVHRLLEKLTITDIILLVLGLLFGLSAKTTFMAFIIPFTLFFGLLLLRKYRLGIWIKLILYNRWIFICLILPIFILSQSWLFIYNHNFWGSWSGPDEFVNLHQQTNGLKGSLANLVRYFFQSIHLLRLGDILSNDISGFTISKTLQDIYDSWLYPLFGDAGIGPYATSTFSISWRSHEDFSWFGPFGFLLVIPAIIYSMLTGKKPLQALSLTLLGYVVIVSYKIVWMPWNGRFFSLFFAASGVCIAYLIKSIKIRQKLLIKLITYISILILFLSAAINESKPLLLSPNKILTDSDIIPFNWPYTIIHDSIWAKTNFGHHRLYYAEHHYRDSRLSSFTKLIPKNSQVALVTRGNSWIYHYLLFNPDVNFAPVKFFSVAHPLKGSLVESNPLNFDYILCLDVKCTPNKIKANQITLWRSNSPEQPGELIKLNP
jgi:hypothetical protein